MNTEEKTSILKLCRMYNDLFHLEGDKLTSATTHSIPLKADSNPINMKQYRLPHSAKLEVNRQV